MKQLFLINFSIISLVILGCLEKKTIQKKTPTESILKREIDKKNSFQKDSICNNFTGNSNKSIIGKKSEKSFRHNPKNQSKDSLNRKRKKYLHLPNPSTWVTHYPRNELYIRYPESRVLDSTNFFNFSNCSRYHGLFGVRIGDSILWSKWQGLLEARDYRHIKVSFKFIEK